MGEGSSLEHAVSLSSDDEDAAALEENTARLVRVLLLLFAPSLLCRPGVCCAQGAPAMTDAVQQAWSDWARVATGSSPAYNDFWAAFQQIDWNGPDMADLSWGSFFASVSQSRYPTHNPHPRHLTVPFTPVLRPQMGLHHAFLPADGSCWNHLVSAWTCCPELAAWGHSELQLPPCPAAQEADVLLRTLLFDTGFKESPDNTGALSDVRQIPVWRVPKRARSGSGPVLQESGSWGGMDSSWPTWRAISVCSPVKVPPPQSSYPASAGFMDNLHI